MEENEVVYEETVHDAISAKDVSKAIHPMVRTMYPNLSGRSKRKLFRQNTVHLRGICPICGKPSMKYAKDIFISAKKTDHNKWVCGKCGTRATREELKNNVKYV